MSSFQNKLMLPWSKQRAEDSRFRVVSFLLCVLFLVPAIWIPLINLPEPEREELEELPPQLAKILAKPKEIPPPPKPKEPEPKETPEPEKAPEPEPKPEKKPEPKPEPVKKELPKPEPKARLIEEAKQVAKKSGLLALQSELSVLRESVDLSSLSSAPVIASKSNTEASKAKKVSLSEATQTSGGVKSGEAVAVSDAQLAVLDSTDLRETDAERALGIAEAEAALGERERSEESFKLAIEQLKAPFNALYKRARRDDPFLEGTVVFEVVVEPDGSVSSCRVVSSSLDNKELEGKLVNRFKLANFGAESVSRTSREIPFNFRI